MEITAAILRETGKPFEMARLEMEEPRADEIRVKLVASGLCHTDIGLAEGEFPIPGITPIVLGHEGSGVVEAVGAEVRSLKPGDRVALTMGSCGSCKNCTRNLPTYCAEMFPRNFSGTRIDGSTPLSEQGAPVKAAFFSQSSFATHAIATERNAIKVPDDVPLELAGPFGCGFQTGAGAVLNALKPARGSAIAIFGVGSVGLSALLAARIAGCTTRIAVDLKEERLEMARALGATHSVNAGQEDAPEAIRALTGGHGVDGAIEASGNRASLISAFRSLGSPGTVITVGVGPGGNGLEEINPMEFTRGKAIRGTIEGDSLFHLFIPELMAFWQDGLFPVDRMVDYYDFADINQAVADSISGKTVKAILRMPA